MHFIIFFLFTFSNALPFCTQKEKESMLAKSQEVEPGFVQIVRHLSDDAEKGKHTVTRYLGDLIKPTNKLVKKSITPSYQPFKRNNYFRKRDGSMQDECAPANKSSPNAQDETFVQDPLPPEGQEVIDVPIKENAGDVHLSDQAFEQAGDNVADTLDFCNAKIYKGKKADEKIAEMKNHAKSSVVPALARN